MKITVNGFGEKAGKKLVVGIRKKMKVVLSLELQQKILQNVRFHVGVLVHADRSIVVAGPKQEDYEIDVVVNIICQTKMRRFVHEEVTTTVSFPKRNPNESEIVTAKVLRRNPLFRSEEMFLEC